jgi:hypothetical protein
VKIHRLSAVSRPSSPASQAETDSEAGRPRPWFDHRWRDRTSREASPRAQPQSWPGARLATAALSAAPRSQYNARSGEDLCEQLPAHPRCIPSARIRHPADWNAMVSGVAELDAGSSVRASPDLRFLNDFHPTPAQPTAEKWPGLLDSTLLTSPKDGCHEPSARRMVCHIPPSSVSPTTCSCPPTPAQPTAEP